MIMLNMPIWLAIVWVSSYDEKIKNMPSYIDNAIKHMPKGDL